jgi:WD40 repeat protein/tetratricopeptide (TPR) repeat protein
MRDKDLAPPAMPRDGPRGWFSRQLVSFTPDVRRALTGGDVGFAQLRDTATGQPVCLASGARGEGPSHDGPFRHTWDTALVTAISPDGRFFATASQTDAPVGEVRLREAATGRLISGPLAHANYVSAMVFSPDSKVLATGGYDRAVHFWDTATGKRIGEPLRQAAIVLQLAFSPDGKSLAVGQANDRNGAYGTVLWDVSARRSGGERIRDYFNTLEFTHDSKRLLLSRNGAFQFFDTATALPASQPITEGGEGSFGIFRPDGRMFLTVNQNGTLRLRDTASGQPVGMPMIGPFRADVAAFSPDGEGKFIVAGYADGSARLWDRATQKPIGPPVFQGRRIVAVTFTPDGRSFVTTAEDGNTRMWRVPVPVEEPLSELSLALRVRTGLQMNREQVVLQLNAEEWRERCARLMEQEGSLRRATVQELSEPDYHEARARDAEQDRDLFAARWHLDRLLALPETPNASRWLLHARRGRVATSSGRFDQAGADYARALAPGSRPLLRNWYRHQIVDCLASRQWQACLWYLDRVIADDPEHWPWYADRAKVHDKLGDSAQRDADLDRALARGADSSYLSQLADEFAGREQWDRAAENYTLAMTRGPCLLTTWHHAVLVRLKKGDLKGYREVCERLVQRAGPTPAEGFANNVAWYTALGSDGVRDYTRLVAFAELAVSKADTPLAKHGTLNTLGAVLYRAGRYQEAVARLNEGIQADGGEPNAQDCLFLAMAYHRLGQSDKASAYLTRATLHKLPAKGLSWEQLEEEILRREAVALVRR